MNQQPELEIVLNPEQTPERIALIGSLRNKFTEILNDAKADPMDAASACISLVGAVAMSFTGKLEDDEKSGALLQQFGIDVCKAMSRLIESAKTKTKTLAIYVLSNDGELLGKSAKLELPDNTELAIGSPLQIGPSRYITFIDNNVNRAALAAFNKGEPLPNVAISCVLTSQPPQETLS